MTRRDFLTDSLSLLSMSAGSPAVLSARPSARPRAQGASPIQATNFESRVVYRSRQNPGYACWVSFFPGPAGQWYLTFEEVTRPEQPYPKMPRERFYAFGLPTGMDKAIYKMEIVLLESRDGLKRWNVVTRALPALRRLIRTGLYHGGPLSSLHLGGLCT